MRNGTARVQWGGGVVNSPHLLKPKNEESDGWGWVKLIPSNIEYGCRGGLFLDYPIICIKFSVYSGGGVTVSLRKLTPPPVVGSQLERDRRGRQL